MTITVRRINSKVKLVFNDLVNCIEETLETDDTSNRLYFLKGGGSHEI